MTAKPRRGLQDIRTRSSLAGNAENPQRKFLDAASLELKKTLCRKVRDAALKRAAEMDQVIAELDAEQARILAAVPASDQGQPRSTAPAPARAAAAPGARHDFTLKY